MLQWVLFTYVHHEKSPETNSWTWKRHFFGRFYSLAKEIFLQYSVKSSIFFLFICKVKRSEFHFFYCNFLKTVELRNGNFRMYFQVDLGRRTAKLRANHRFPWPSNSESNIYDFTCFFGMSNRTINVSRHVYFANAIYELWNFIWLEMFIVFILR